MSGTNQKLFIMVTKGLENPEMAIIPFVMATTALAMDKDVTMGFQGAGVSLMKKGAADQVTLPDFPALSDLLSAYIEGGGQMHVCSPCMQARKIKEDELVEGAMVVGAATFVNDCDAASTVMFY
jgi:predicted peroxiredoxin